MVRNIFSVLFVGMLLAACQAAQGLQEVSDRNMMGFAVGKSYSKIASTPDFGEDSLGRVTLYGPDIGSFQLASGDVVHRHLKRYGASTTTTDFGFIKNSEKVRYAYRLAYFRVGADGTVKDYAVGNLPGETTKCAGYFYGIVQKCEGGEQVSQSIAVYDQIVQTSSKQPLSSWGPPASIAYGTSG